MKRVLLVTNIPTPYRIPLFNELHGQFEEAGLDVLVVFGAAGYSRRKWTIDLSDCLFNYQILDSDTFAYPRDTEHPFFLYGSLIRTLRSYRPDLIIVAGFSIATLKVLSFSRINRIPYLIWSGAIPRKGYPVAAWRTRLRKLLARNASGGIAYGTRARAYLASLGIPEQHISIAINTVDTSFFSVHTQKHRSQYRDHSPSKTLLYIGHLTQGKRLDLLLEALAGLVRQRTDFRLDIVGEGPAQADLERLTVQHDLEAHVYFNGYRQRNELPMFLAQARCFVFPSDYDIWGLVLNEAMAAGLPCLASIHAGATTDLIQDHVNGFRLDFSDTDKTIQHLNWVLDHPEEITQMGRQAQDYIEQHASLTKSARGFIRAIQLLDL